MINRHFPFGYGAELQTPQGLTALFERIQTKQWPRTGPVEHDRQLQSLLAQLLNPEPEERAQAAQVLKHRWITDKVSSSGRGSVE